MNNYVLMNDKVAKKIFKNSKVSKELTARIVSEILNIDYEDIYNNIRLISEEVAFSALTVDSRTDVMLESNSIYVDVEICYTKGSTRDAQTNTYVYQIFLSQIKNYHDYKKIKKVIQILIENYDYFNENKFIYDVVLMEKNLHLIEVDWIEKYHVNLEYLRKLGYNIIINEEEKLSKLLYFLVCEKDMLEEVYKGDEFMEKVVKEAREIAGLDNLNLYFSEEEVQKMDMEESYEKGLNDGIVQKEREMVINMFNKNISTELIAECANLTTREVNEIIGNNENKSK